MYILRKWYCDLLTTGGTYLFVYFAYVRLAGVTTRSLVLHIAPEGSARPQTFSLPVNSFREGDGGRLDVALKDGRLGVDRKVCHLAARNSRADVDLHYTLVVPGGTRPVRIEPSARGHVLWEPLGLRYRVDGQLTLDGLRVAVEGSAGYADFLESTILPPWVPVRRLLWGRAHLPDADLTFMRASGEAGSASWSRFLLHRGGKIEESDNVAVTDQSARDADPSDPNTGGYVLRVRLPDENLCMTVRRRKPVQCASFIDQQAIRWPMARALAKKVTRDPHGSKYLSSIDVMGWGTHDPPPLMIDEEAFL